MTTYSTYQAAKIANPNCEIYKLERNGMFAHCDHHKAELVRFVEFDSNGIKCNPADYCMTVDRFLADGNRLQVGDLFIGTGGDVIGVEVGEHLEEMHRNQESDRYRFILRAAALEEKEPELTKDDSPQGILSAISNRLHNIGCEHQGFDLGEELGSMACDIWGVLPMISNESIEEKKPSTKVEYVRVNKTTINLEALMAELLDGVLFYNGEQCGGHYPSQTALMKYIKGSDSLYRRIETEIDERQEFIEAVSSYCNDNGYGVNERFLGSIFDSNLVKLVN